MMDFIIILKGVKYMNNQKTKSIVYNALLIAIVVILAVVPNLGFIQVGGMAITIVHIPVIIAAILFGYKSALLMGFAFGISSLLVAATRGAAFDILYVNPLVSVVPRVLFAIATVAIYNFTKTLIKDDIINVGISAFLSSLVHSILVISALYLSVSLGFADEFLSMISGGFWAFIFAMIGLQVLGEAVLATIVTVPVVKALRKVINR